MRGSLKNILIQSINFTRSGTGNHTLLVAKLHKMSSIYAAMSVIFLIREIKENFHQLIFASGSMKRSQMLTVSYNQCKFHNIR